MRAPSSFVLAVVLLAVACGQPRPTSSPSTASDVGGDATDESESEPESQPESETESESEPESEALPTGCAGRIGAQCRREDGCVWDVSGCREPVDACELVEPNPSWSGEPIFQRGDPCENVRAECAWSTTLGRCAPFTALPACPGSLAEAEAAQVSCSHSAQPALDCSYGRTHCSCTTPHYCGGAPPPPSIAYPPGTFTCIPPVDARGCPTGEIRAGSSCHVSASVECTTCYTISRCVGGHWRVQQLPPRP